MYYYFLIFIMLTSCISCHVHKYDYFDRLFKTEDAGQSWSLCLNASVHSVRSPFFGDTVYVGCVGEIARSTNGGESWTFYAIPASAKIISIATPRFSANPVYVGTDGAGVYKSVDGGENWMEINEGLGNLTINAIKVIGDTIYAGTDEGVWKYVGEWSTNGPYGQKISSLIINPYFHYISAGSMGGGVFWSPDRGETWMAMNDSLEDLNVTSLTYTAPYGKNCEFIDIFAGTEASGIFLWLGGDSIALWHEVNNDLTDLRITALTSDEWHTIYAGTKSGKLFITCLGWPYDWIELTPIDEADYVIDLDARDGTTLYAAVSDTMLTGIPEYVQIVNCPNPFIEKTEFYYSVPEPRDGYVSLKIYNLCGCLIKTLVDNLQEPDEYEVTWDGRDRFGKEITTGLYFSQLRVTNFIQSSKLLLIR